MGLFLRSEEKRSEYQEKIVADLRKKIAEEQEKADGADLPDGVEDSVYMKDFVKKTSANGRVVALLVVLTLAAIVAVLVAMFAK